MKYLLLVLLAGWAVKCDDNYFVVEAPEDHTEDHERPFNVYWNVPTMQCRSKKIPFKNLYEKYGIHQNKDDSFRGDKISILYDPGLFPALLNNKTTGTLHFRNGGVPQEGDLELHVKTFKSILNKNIPDPHFNGVGIIDFEWWRPIFRHNMGNLVITKNISIEIQKNLHWEPDLDIHKEARLRFEKAARTFMKTTLSVAKQMRPNALWGYYGFPYCFNMANKNMKETCADKIPEENDRTRWLWSESTALYPSVYSSKDLTSSQLADLIRGRVKEAQRVKIKGTAVLPYFWFRYREGGFLSAEDLNTALETLYKSHASGFIIWGSSEDVNTVSKCKELRHYVENTLGPAISAFTNAKTKSEDEILQIKTKKKAPHNKLSEKSNHTYREVLDIYWKPPENCVQDINKYVEEELKRKGYTFINQAMTNLNYSIHIKIPFNSLKKTTTTGQGQGSINKNEIPIELKITETIDSSPENSVSELLKDIQNTSDIPREKTSQISRKIIILKKLMQIQQLTKEILALEMAETIDLKHVTREHLKADSSSIQDDVKKNDIELTSKPPASPVVLNSTLSTVDITPIEKPDKQESPLPTEKVSNEMVLNGTASSFETSTENLVPKLSDHQSSRSELSQSYENSNKTSSGDHSIVKLQEDSEAITKPPILETTQTVEFKDVTRDDLITDVTTVKDNRKGENIELKPLPTEFLGTNGILSITESPATKTVYPLPTENVTNEIMPNGTGPIEDLVPKLLEIHTSSTESTNSYVIPNKTSSRDNFVTHSTNLQTTTEIPILKTINLKNDTQKDLNINVAVLQNNTKKAVIVFEIKPLPIEKLQLNDSLYYNVEVSTIQSYDTQAYSLPTESVSNEIIVNGTMPTLKANTEDLTPELIGNYTSSIEYFSTESTHSSENFDKSFRGEESVSILLQNTQAIEIPIPETTQRNYFKDQKLLGTDVTLSQGDLKKENIELPLQQLPIETLQLNNTLYYSIETPTTETQDKLTLEFPTENVSKEIITNEWKPILKPGTDNLDAILLGNQTSSVASTDNYVNLDKTSSGGNIGLNLFLQSNQSRLEVGSTEISTLRPQTSQTSSTEVLVMKLLENEEFTTEIPNIENGETIDPKNDNQERFNADVAKEQDDLKTGEIEMGLKISPTESLELNDTLSTEKTTTDIRSNRTEPFFKITIEDIVPKLLENQTSDTKKLTTKSTKSFENSNKTVRGEYLVAKLPKNDQVTTEIPTLETTVLMNDTQKSSITEFSDLQDGIKQEEIEVGLPTVSLQLNDTLSKTEGSSTKPQDSESENDVFETTTFETLTKDKPDSIESLHNKQ